MKPNEDADNFRNKSSGSSASSLKGRFAKPVDSDEDDHSHLRKHELPVDRGTREWGDRSRSRGGARGGWKKPGCKKEERRGLVKGRRELRLGITLIMPIVKGHRWLSEISNA